ncbi:MAG TPA: DUF4340 domain-containing protein [Leptolyngbyaceae cyanobacterium]
MKLQRSTVVLVGLALLLGAGVLISEARRAPSSQDEQLVQKAKNPLFGFDEEAVAALTVERNGETLEFKRDEQNTWQMVRPTATPAEEGAVAFLLSRLVTDAPLRQITLTPDQQAQFGFDKPSGTVKLTLKGGETHTVVLGAKDFSGNSLYALVDHAVPLAKDAGEVPLYVVSLDVANGVERPLAEWKLAPAASTPTSEGAPAASTPTTLSPPDSQPSRAAEPDPAASTPSSGNSSQPNPKSSTNPKTETPETTPAKLK